MCLLRETRQLELLHVHRGRWYLFALVEPELSSRECGQRAGEGCWAINTTVDHLDNRPRVKIQRALGSVVFQNETSRFSAPHDEQNDLIDAETR